jgi:VanZ family protein
MLETSQLFSHSRYPSATDVACNVGGAALGIAAFRFLATYRAREPVQTGAD